MLQSYFHQNEAIQMYKPFSHTLKYLYVTNVMSNVNEFYNKIILQGAKKKIKTSFTYLQYLNVTLLRQYLEFITYICRN